MASLPCPSLEDFLGAQLCSANSEFAVAAGGLRSVPIVDTSV